MKERRPSVKWAWSGPKKLCYCGSYDCSDDMTVKHEELMAVIAHEMGHVAKNHMPYLILAHSANIILSLALFILIAENG